jgi:hypothetical protein
MKSWRSLAITCHAVVCALFLHAAMTAPARASCGDYVIMGKDSRVIMGQHSHGMDHVSGHSRSNESMPVHGQPSEQQPCQEPNCSRNPFPIAPPVQLQLPTLRESAIRAVPFTCCDDCPQVTMAIAVEIGLPIDFSNTIFRPPRAI